MVNEVKVLQYLSLCSFLVKEVGQDFVGVDKLQQGGRAHNNLNWMVWTTALLGLEYGLKNTSPLEARSVRLEKSGIFLHSFLSWLVHS